MHYGMNKQRKLQIRAMQQLTFEQWSCFFPRDSIFTTVPFQNTTVWSEHALCRLQACSVGVKVADRIL